jgi:hypothetical protein
MAHLHAAALVLAVSFASLACASTVPREDRSRAYRDRERAAIEARWSADWDRLLVLQLEAIGERTPEQLRRLAAHLAQMSRDAEALAAAKRAEQIETSRRGAGGGR